MCFSGARHHILVDKTWLTTYMYIVQGQVYLKNPALNVKTAERKCLNFTYMNLNDLEINFKVTGKQLSNFYKGK